MVSLGIKNKAVKLLNLGFLATVLSISHINSVVAVEYSASFKNADINEFINIVGKNLKKTIVLDPTVRGSINVRSYDLLNETQYYQFFLNVLEVYGFAIVEMESGIIKVIKAKDAKVAAIPVVDDDQFRGDEMVTRVVPVTNVSVRELAPLLRQLNDNAGGGNVVHYDPSNVIMITGRAAVVNRLVKIIHRVDTAGDQEVDIVKLRFASALEMVKVVEAIQKPASGTKNTTPSILQPRLVADERTNSLIISGEKKTRARIVALVKKLDDELKNNGNTRVFYLKYAQAKELVSVLKGVSKSLEKGGGESTKTTSSSNSDLSIEAHEGTNSIIVSAQPALMSSLSSIIRQLDIRRAQVLVEAIIVEVSEDDGINLSVQWGSAIGGTSFQDNGVSTGEVLAAAYEVSNDDDDLDAVTSVISALTGGALGFAGSDWGVLLQAISSNSTSNILATPSITTLDNQEASFIVGDEVPVLTGSTSSSTNDNPFQTIERKDVGIKLKVTPQINDGDAVQLTIEQEVSNIQGSTSVDVIFATRSVKTTVLAKSGETIIIGGLIDEAVSETVEKVPLLGDIPLLGHLFRSTKSSTSKRNLMIFLRASIIRDDETMNNLSTRKYGLMRDIQLGHRESGINLMPNKNAPVLPEWGQSHEINPADFSPTKLEKTSSESVLEVK
jgi:general secretion pathway protein D